MNTRRVLLSGAVGVLLIASLPGIANASSGISFGFNFGPPVYYPPPPVYYSVPPNGYYPPPPIPYGYGAPPGYGYGGDNEAYARHEWLEHSGWRHNHDDDDD